jgi:hypothetical protein
MFCFHACIWWYLHHGLITRYCRANAVDNRRNLCETTLLFLFSFLSDSGPDNHLCDVANFANIDGPILNLKLICILPNAPEGNVECNLGNINYRLQCCQHLMRKLLIEAADLQGRLRNWFC